VNGDRLTFVGANCIGGIIVILSEVLDRVMYLPLFSLQLG